MTALRFQTGAWTSDIHSFPEHTPTQLIIFKYCMIWGDFKKVFLLFHLSGRCFMLPVQATRLYEPCKVQQAREEAEDDQSPVTVAAQGCEQRTFCITQ